MAHTTRDIIATTGTSYHTKDDVLVPYRPDPVRQEVFNVKDYGALGNNSQDDYPFIMRAYVALVKAGGGVLYFPPGSYRFGTALAFTAAVPLTICGLGKWASTLKPTFSAGDAITINGLGFVETRSIGVVPTVARDATAYNIRFIGCTFPQARNVYMNNATGGFWFFDGCPTVAMSDCSGDTSTGLDLSAGGTCLRIKGASSGGRIANNFFRTSGGTPCGWITGTCTSLTITTTEFGGGGPHSSWAVAGITSVAGSFTVTTALTHDFSADDTLVLRGMTPAAYNDVWHITSCTSTTITVTSTANPGPSTVNGTAESLSTALLISNEDGPVNESTVSNCIMSGVTGFRHYGQVSVLMDGRRSVSSLTGWNLDSNYYDFGMNGVALLARATSPPTLPTISGVHVDGQVVAQTRALWLQQTANVVAGSNLTSGGVVVGDSISPSCGVYLYAGASPPHTMGVQLNGHIGRGRLWADVAGSRAFQYGIVLDGAGQIGINVGPDADVYGSTAPVLNLNGAAWGPETVDVWQAAGALVPPTAPWGATVGVVTATRATFMRFVPTRTFTASKMSFVLSTAAGSNDSIDLGIYDSTLTTLLGSTGSTAGKLNGATGVQSINLTTSVDLIQGNVYYAASSFGAIGTTAAQVVQMNSGINLAMQIMGTTPPSVTGAIALPLFPLTTPVGALGVAQLSPILAVLP